MTLAESPQLQTKLASRDLIPAAVELFQTLGFESITTAYLLLGIFISNQRLAKSKKCPVEKSSAEATLSTRNAPVPCSAFTRSANRQRRPVAASTQPGAEN
ncbi:MAG: hypothetical protein M9920_10165 [Verrucomicrobiae bacterium]|nr:hypothetical protein [Verrucomicrobiae bacterium]